MDWAYLHIVLNHFPIVLGLVGGAAALLAALSRRASVWRFAAVIVLLAGLTAPAAFLAGREAEESVEELWYVDEETIEEHEEAGLLALIALLAAGLAGAAVLRKPRASTRGALLGLSLLGAVLVARAAAEGGEIIHENPVLEAGPTS